MVHEIPRSRNHERLFLAILFLLSFLAYTWGNTFPYFYHSDEESKALQLLYGYRNYWHPMLTLNATDALCGLLRVGSDPQRMTVIGRTMAALFSSIGVVSLTSFAFQRKGLLVGMLTGVLLLTLPLLFEVSHYCKEDPALFMALTLSLCAWNRFLVRQDLRNAILLGLSTGLAISAKYPGSVLVPLLACVILFRFKSFRLTVTFLATALFLTLVINWQWLLHTSEMLTGLQRENHMLAAGHDGVPGSSPHFFYLRILLYQHGWILLLLANFGALQPLTQSRTLNLETALAAIALLSLVFLSSLSKVSDRYLLPVMLIAVYLAAIGISLLRRMMANRYRPTVLALLILAVFWHQTSLLITFIEGFRTDSRAALVSWMNDHLPPGAKVATSLWTRLPGLYKGEFFLDPTPPDYVADHGSLADLRAEGYLWIAVADVELQHLASDQQTGSNRHLAAFQRRRLFYQDLMRQNPPIWHQPAGLVYILHPGLSLYRLPP